MIGGGGPVAGMSGRCDSRTSYNLSWKNRSWARDRFFMARMLSPIPIHDQVDPREKLSVKTKGGYIMADIQWIHDFDEGLKQANDAKKPLFLDFFKDG